MAVTSTATEIAKKSSGAKGMARKSTGRSALPKYRGVRRVKGKEVGDKLPPVKKYRISPGVRALAEIRRYQKSTELLIKRLPFQRLVRDAVTDYLATECPCDRVPSDQVSSDPVPKETQCLVTRDQFKSNRKMVVRSSLTKFNPIHFKIFF